MKDNWIFDDSFSIDNLENLKKNFTLNDSLLKILIKRGYDSVEKIKKFLEPSFDDLHDPFLMLNMDKACKKVLEAIEKREKIVVYGDYDVDGTTSVAMVFSFLRELNANVETYIPDRYSEGYGISEKSIALFAENQIKIILALDCGTRDLKNIKMATNLGMSVIVCDHHEPGPELPEAFAILNPKQKNCEYPFKELSGCGVSFKLLQGLSIFLNSDKKKYYKYLDLVAVSTCCDIVPLINENRIFVHYGIQKLCKKPIDGLAILSKLSNLSSEQITVSDIVFGIGPRINAAGRISHANEALKVLIGEKSDALNEKAQLLNDINESRKIIDNNITIEALEMLASENIQDDVKFSTVLFNQDWHKGIVGIVASRCIEVYHRPTIILTKSDDGLAVGSARSIPGFNLYETLCECSDLLIKFGGHEHAAGLSLEISNIECFKNRFEKIVSSRLTPFDLIPKIMVDERVQLSVIDDRFFEEMNLLAPFGPKNMQPIFYCEMAKILDVEIIKENHIKLHFSHKKGSIISGIAFNMAKNFEKLQHGDHISMLYSIQKDYFGEGLSLRIRDIN